MARRTFLRQLAALPFLGAITGFGQQAPHKSLNIMMKSAWGSDDPPKAAFPFLHGLALSEAGAHGTNLPAGRSCVAHAEIGSCRRCASRLAGVVSLVEWADRVITE